MRLSLYNELNGCREELRPAEPAVCRIKWCRAAGLRAAFFRELLERALAYLGYAVREAESGDIQNGGRRPCAGLWLKLAAEDSGLPSAKEVQGKGFDVLDLKLLCLKTHYRAALEFSWEALEAARAERAELGETARRLAEARVAPNAAGLAGYKKRFRDALANDLDGPEAIATLWDALRPGALSPGSRLAALRDADQVLGLLRLR